MFVIQCPACGEETKMSLLKGTYLGPFVCWKCEAAFTVVIQNEELKSAEPITDERSG